MKRSLKQLIPLVAGLLLLTPGVVLAQEPGVTFDKGPSSKEYAIPLDAARAKTKTKAPKPKSTPTPAPAATTPTPPAPSTGGAASGTPSKKATTTTTAEPTQTQTQAAAPAGTTPPTSADGAPVSNRSSSNGIGAGVIIASLAVAALVLGGLAGLVLRRRRTPIDEY
jgi:MYXO-CTERM domain-containing protein